MNIHDRRAEVLARAAALDWPEAIGAGVAVAANEASWERTVRLAAEPDLRQLERYLDAASARRDHREESAARDEQRIQARLGEDPRTAADAATNAAAVDAGRYAASDAGKMDRLIAANERVAAALEKRG